MTQLTIKCVIREISTFYSVRARMCMCGSGSSILLAFVHARAKLAWVREISFHALSLNFISPCWQLCQVYLLDHSWNLKHGCIHCEWSGQGYIWRLGSCWVSVQLEECLSAITFPKRHDLQWRDIIVQSFVYWAIECAQTPDNKYIS